MQKFVAKGELVGFNPPLFNNPERVQITLEERWFAKDGLVHFESNGLTLSLTASGHKYVVSGKKIKQGYYEGSIYMKDLNRQAGKCFLWVYEGVDEYLITGHREETECNPCEVWGKLKLGK